MVVGSVSTDRKRTQSLSLMVHFIGFWFLSLNNGISVCYGIHSCSIIVLCVSGTFDLVAFCSERSMKVFTREGLMCRIHYKVWILCNDCNDTTEAYFHILGQKCCHC
ncbi:unnamed protein product [Lupinus luteus]|uniref:RCHY1 zinc-ribbon domain-containing protein n=1 Tax=Lupinus luteus TaxID=3873 RepID=A0AAV1X8J8_LUPLU